MKLSKVWVRRYLGIENAEINLNDGVNVVRGRNGSGKSSLLSAIKSALGYGRTDPKVIHNDGDHAEIMVELDDAMRIRRRIDQDGTKLSVTETRGKLEVEVKQARKWLSEIVGAIGLDPTELYRANPAERRRILLSVVPPKLTVVDVAKAIQDELVFEFDDENVARATASELASSIGEAMMGLDGLSRIESDIMSRRSAAWANKERWGKAADVATAGLPAGYHPEDVPETATVMRELDEANRSAQKLIASRHESSRTHAVVRTCESNVKIIKQEIDHLQIKLKSAELDLENAKAMLNAAESEERRCGQELIDAEPIKTRMAELDDRRAVRKRYDEAMQLRAESEKQEIYVRAYDRVVRRAIRERLPEILWSRIGGSPLGAMQLTMDDGALRVDGKDIDNLSESERLRLAMAVARATAGELKLICADGIEALDKTTLAEFQREAADDGFQYVIAVVDDGDMRIDSQ